MIHWEKYDTVPPLFKNLRFFILMTYQEILGEVTLCINAFTFVFKHPSLTPAFYCHLILANFTKTNLICIQLQNLSIHAKFMQIHANSREKLAKILF